MKSKVLSAGIGSVPAFTTPCTVGAAIVNGEKDTDADALAPTLAVSVSMTCPSISSDTGMFVAGVALLFATPAVTVTRS